MTGEDAVSGLNAALQHLLFFCSLICDKLIWTDERNEG